MADPLTCLVAAIFFEARDQPLLGQEMVAQVVMNRVTHPDFPNDVCSVVYESKQFSFTHDGLSDDPADYTTYFDRRARESVTELAQEYLMGATTEGEARRPLRTTGNTSTHYHTLSVEPVWRSHYTVDGIVGDHVFYTCSKTERNC